MGVRLPSAYQETEYIESTGAQWIDTGIVHGKFVHDIAFTANGRQLMGCHSTSSKFWGSSGKKAYYELHASKINTDTDKRNIVIYDNTNDPTTSLTAAGVTKTATITGPNPLPSYVLFRINNENYYASARLYHISIYDIADDLIYDGIPCYRKSDSVAGLYDLVGRTFYPNQGTGSFLVGPDVIDSISPLMVAWRRAMMSQMQPRLPIEYQEVPFIIGQGKQYIDTGYVLNSGCRVQGRYDLYESTKLGSVMALFGARASNYNNTFAVFNVTNAPRIDYGKTLTTHSFSYAVINDRSVVDFDLNAGIATVNGRTYAFADSLKPFTCPSTALIFAVHTENTVDTRHPKGEIVYLKITDENGTVVRDMIPCYRKADNKPGMYDLANNQFYTNAGTGDFQLPS